ncbi:MAG: ribonuclease III [Cyanobacteria bacterium P01_D01_bin.105]
MSIFQLPNFQDPQLWQQAMTHSSFVNEQPTAGEHNERLEFLGDAILTFISGAYLYARYPNRPEGELTVIRSALVDKPQLCYFAKQLKLGKYLRLGKGAQQEGSRKSDRLLSSAFEALIGAYFLDTQQDIRAIKRYIEPMFGAVVDEAIARSINAKSQLQEWAQKETGQTPVYKLIDSIGPDHAKRFIVQVSIGSKRYGQGKGDSKKQAEKAAAQASLKHIKQEGMQQEQRQPL